MTEKIGMSVEEFTSFLEEKAQFVVNKANAIVARDNPSIMNNFQNGIYASFWYVTHRLRLNDNINLDNYLNLPKKQQNWSKWLFGLPKNYINSIRYQHKAYPDLSILGKEITYKNTDFSIYTRPKQNLGNISMGAGGGVRKFYRWQDKTPIINLYSYDKIYFDKTNIVRIFLSEEPEDYFDITSFSKTFYVPSSNLLIPSPDYIGHGVQIIQKIDGNLTYLTFPYFVLKYADEIIENDTRLDEQLDNAKIEEMLDLIVPSIFFNGQKFRPLEREDKTDGTVFVQEIGRRADPQLNSYYSVQIPSDDNQFLVEMAIGYSNLRFNIARDSNTKLFQYLVFGRSTYDRYYPGSQRDKSRNLVKMDGVTLWKRPSELESPDYENYDRFNNISRSLLITEYLVRDSQLDGKIEPLWFGWGPLPPSLGFDLSKISVSGEPPITEIYHPEKQEDGKLVWNRDINKLFGEIVPPIDPNTGVSHQNINPGKYVLIPDNY